MRGQAVLLEPCSRAAQIVLILVSCAVLGGCRDADQGAARSTTSSSVTVPSGVVAVPLAAPAPELPEQCRDAAASLGFAVPCPTRLPLVAGVGVACSDSCVATAGGDATLDRVFFLQVEGYDSAEPTETVHHLVVEARRIDRAPPSPCFDGAPLGHLPVNGRDLTLLDCPTPTAEQEASIVHGEGAHASHLLGYWDANGIRNVVSVHGGATPSNRSLLQQLAASIELVNMSTTDVEGRS